MERTWTKYGKMSQQDFWQAFREWVDCSINSLEDLEKEVDKVLNTQVKFDEYMLGLNES